MLDLPGCPAVMLEFLMTSQLTPPSSQTVDGSNRRKDELRHPRASAYDRHVIDEFGDVEPEAQEVRIPSGQCLKLFSGHKLLCPASIFLVLQTCGAEMLCASVSLPRVLDGLSFGSQLRCYYCWSWL
jgi:hypothetical protein